MLFELAVLCLTSSFLNSGCYASNECGSLYKEGDKWFDGCNWCTCISDAKKCTNIKCPSSDSKEGQPKACQKIGESWRDGCFHCHCLTTGIIYCKNDRRCHISLLKTPNVCEISANFVDQESCICGVDGVPSCVYDVLSRFPSKSTPATVSVDKGILVPLDDGGPSIRLREGDGENIFAPLRATGDEVCLLGSRWYGGGMRCYCDKESGVICGNPRYVARKIDGFKIRRKKCSVGEQFEERCSRCSCKAHSLSFCEIDRQCLKNTNIRHSLISKPSGENECEIGTRWRDGCKRCRCNKRGKPVCKSRHCNQSTDDKTGSNALKGRDSSTGGRFGKPKTPFKMPHKPSFRMPDLYPGSFFKRPKRPMKVTANCNGFKPGDKYWDKCNLCHCTPAGEPLCSSKIC